MPTGYSEQPQPSWLQEYVAAPQVLSGQAMPDYSFGIASEGGQPGELLALGSLFDLPLYNNTEPLAAAPPTPSPADAYPLQLQSHPTPAYTFDKPTRHAGPGTYGLPQDDAFGQRPQPLVDPAGALCFAAPAEQLPPSQPLPSYSWNALATLDHTPAVPSPTSHSIPLDVHTLLDDPLTATLIASQMSKPRHRNNRPSQQPQHSTQPAAVIGPSAAPITKPKRKKLRPNDTINTLQQHLDGLASTLQYLALRNDRLQRKRQVLGFFMQELANIETIAAEIHIGKLRHEADPSQPPQGAAAYQYWTPQQFGEAYHDFAKMAGRWIMRVEASASGTPTPTDVAEMEEALHDFMQLSLCTSYGRIDFMARAMAVQLQQFPRTSSEEEHWSSVLEAMVLTEGQVEDLLVAREVYLEYSETFSREHGTAAATLQQRTQQAAAATSGAPDHPPEPDQFLRLLTTVRKMHTLNMILVLFWFRFILTPAQAARAAVHAYPLIPGGTMLSNTLHALRGPAPSGPQLGPPPGPMATVRSASAMLQLLTGGIAAGGPSLSTPPTIPTNNNSAPHSLP